MLTQKELIVKCLLRGIGLGKTPWRYIMFLREKGLIEAIGKDEYDLRKITFPDDTPDRIKKIRKLQIENGYSLRKVTETIDMPI